MQFYLARTIVIHSVVLGQILCEDGDVINEKAKKVDLLLTEGIEIG